MSLTTGTHSLFSARNTLYLPLKYSINCFCEMLLRGLHIRKGIFTTLAYVEFRRGKRMNYGQLVNTKI